MNSVVGGLLISPIAQEFAVVGFDSAWSYRICKVGGSGLFNFRCLFRIVMVSSLSGSSERTTMFGDTVTESAMSVLWPYLAGKLNGTTLLWKCDVSLIKIKDVEVNPSGQRNGQTHKPAYEEV